MDKSKRAPLRSHGCGRAVVMLIFGLPVSAVVFFACMMALMFVISLTEQYSIQQNLHAYPGSTYLGSGSYEYPVRENVIFVWTAADREVVQTHYEQYTYPFIDQSDRLISILHLSDNPRWNPRFAPVRGLEADSASEVELTKASETYSCYWLALMSCLSIRLSTLDTNSPLNLDALVGSLRWHDRADTASIRGGTLIEYWYFS